MRASYLYWDYLKGLFDGRSKHLGRWHEGGISYTGGSTTVNIIFHPSASRCAGIPVSLVSNCCTHHVAFMLEIYERILESSPFVETNMIHRDGVRG